MVTAFVLLVAKPIVLVPTDDVWVYPNASDPQSDAYLRVWGAQGQAVAGKDADLAEFSYSFLKFDVSGIPANAKLKSVKLVLTHIAHNGYSAEVAKRCPLQVRTLGSDFSEKKWNYDQAAKLVPGSILGAVNLPGEKSEKEFEVALTFDLKAFEKFWSMNKKTLAIALTAAVSPADDGRASIYKFYSKDNPKPEWGPKLILEIKD